MYPPPKKRLGIFAHYDADAQIKPAVVHYVRHLRAECDRVVFVSTATLSEAEIEKVRPYCGDVFVRENVGFDFAMWQHAIRRTDLAQWDELVLANSSVVGPVRPLGDLFRRMASSSCDFWGITQSTEYCVHLQSYFLVFRSRVLHSEAFRTFFDSVLPFEDKQQVIFSYELSLTHWFEQQGFSWEAVFPHALFERPNAWFKRDLGNPAVMFADKLLRMGDPFVKIEVLRLKRRGVPVRGVLKALAAAGYPRELATFDRRKR